MAFRFSLQPVLRIRASFERLEQLRLLSLSAMIECVRQEIDAFDAQSLQLERELQRGLADGTPAAELQFESIRRKARSQQKQSLEDQSLELNRRRHKQQLLFQAARQKREILENFRQRKWTEYQLEQRRREQRQLDELFLLRRAAKSDEEII
jgi:flagellar export protein FliJ